MPKKSSSQEATYRPIVSLREARKLLGKTAKVLTDKEVLDAVHSMDNMAKILANNNFSSIINQYYNTNTAEKDDDLQNMKG